LQRKVIFALRSDLCQDEGHQGRHFFFFSEESNFGIRLSFLSIKADAMPWCTLDSIGDMLENEAAKREAFAYNVLSMVNKLNAHGTVVTADRVHRKVELVW
jgi:hypothetical protein